MLSSFGRSLSGGGLFGSRLLVQGEVSPFRMDSESLDFQRTCQVLVPLPEIVLFASTLEGGRTLLPVVKPSHPSRSFSESWRRSLRKERMWSWGSILASETMVPEVIVSSGGTSQNSPSSEGPCFPSLYLSLWPLSGRKERKESSRAFLLEI